MADVRYVGEAYAWIEQGSSIHLKAASKNGDPIEFTAQEARELGQALIELAESLTVLDYS